MTARKKVLLVDDVELFLELEKTFFRRESFDLLVARDGAEALEIIRTQRPDLVFMDLYMPQMSGEECCRQVKEDPQLRSTPIVMVTHGGREEELARCRAAGCDDIVLKPINRHHFLDTARKYLQIADRSTPRVKARLRIRFGADPQQLLTDYSVNLSTGGVFIETHSPLSYETPLAVELELPNPARTIRCRGRVAWINPADLPTKPDMPPGMGIQFVDLPLDELEALREFIKKECLDPSW